MTAHRRPLLTREIAVAALLASLRKLDPRVQVRNPVMFVVELGSAITTGVVVADLVRGRTDGLWFTGVVAVWLWLNPRLFRPPARTDTWSAMATFGERVWLNREAVPIPAHHTRMANILSVVAALGAPAALAGAFLNDLTATLAGAAVVILGKLWFCDRMVWLYRDMKDCHPPYAAWLRPCEEA